MPEALLLDAGIIVPKETKASLQVCRLECGSYCISAYETTSDATEKRTILLRINRDQLAYIIKVFQRSYDEGEGDSLV